MLRTLQGPLNHAERGESYLHDMKQPPRPDLPPPTFITRGRAASYLGRKEIHRTSHS